LAVLFLDSRDNAPFPFRSAATKRNALILPSQLTQPPEPPLLFPRISTTIRHDKRQRAIPVPSLFDPLVVLSTSTHGCPSQLMSLRMDHLDPHLFEPPPHLFAALPQPRPYGRRRSSSSFVRASTLFKDYSSLITRTDSSSFGHGVTV
jgi:hypothetical protein